MHRLRLLYPIAALLVACGHAAPPAPTADASSTRTTPSGPIVGAAGDAGEHVWRGIPFAQPPTGDRRWRAPAPMPPWTDTREALTVGSPCPQYASPLGGVPGKEGSVVGSEDCLYLNVYAPRFAPKDVPAGAQRLPVMLWIHGGGNSIGEAGLLPSGQSRRGRTRHRRHDQLSPRVRSAGSATRRCATARRRTSSPATSPRST